MQMNRKCSILKWDSDASRLDVLSATKLSGSGAIFSVALTPVLDGFEMFVCEDTGEVSCWLVSGAGHHVSKQHSIQFSSTSCSAYNVEPLSPSLLLTCSAAGLSLSNYDRKESTETFSLMWHDISCCGVASAGPTGTEFYAVGDLSGRVLLWGSKIAHDGAPCLVLQHEAGIRCVSSFPLPSGSNSCVLLAGLMDGSVHQYILEGNERPTVVKRSVAREPEFDTTVTCIAFHPTLPLAVVADSRGKLQVFKDENGNYTATDTTFLNVQRDHVSSREIWSVAFSSDGKLLALGNEDFTVKILKFGVDAPLELLHTLTGPTAATTAVRWLGDSVYASSDDCSIHVWKVSESSSELRRVLRTDPSHLVRYCATQTESRMSKLKSCIYAESDDHILGRF
jgi:WD40 repeat protein